ncbi:Signal peptide, CUB and EGF-like domain-containing protein 2, partial [Acromyrmex echinatior]
EREREREREREERGSAFRNSKSKEKHSEPRERPRDTVQVFGCRCERRHVMCIEKRASHARLACAVLFLVAITLPFGLCQNARGTSGDRMASNRSGDGSHTLGIRRQYSGDASFEGMETLKENRRTLSSRGVIKEPEKTEAEAKAEARGDERGDKHLLLSENGAKILPRRNVNVTTLSKQQEGNFGSRTRKKRRRGKEESGGSDVKDRLHEITEDSRENEIMGKRDRSPRKRSDPFSKLRPKNREARKSRAERRRRKKDRKERNRGSGKDTRRNDRRQDVARRKRKRKTHDGGLSGRVLDKLDLAGTNTSETTIENSSSFTPDRASLTEAIVTTTSSSLQRHPTLETTRRLTRTTPRRGVYAADTVEREFSKQLEMEISKSALKDSSILDDGIFDTPPKKSTVRNAAAKEVNGKSVNQDAVASLEGKIDFKSSHYDAERMLGYSRTEEDLPILDLENEVLERTLKDYNAYMTSRLKPLSLPRYDELPIRRNSGTHPPRKPIINSEESVEEIGDGNTEVTDVTGAMQDDSSMKGDLTCINGTFLPAPLSRHALIKYVKSSTPGHEYLEADYECVPGYGMVSSASRLVCRNRQWVGQVPKCEIKQNPNRMCAEVSCEHVCNEINGRPVCSCYEGFRLDGRKCVDINECLLNNGHGPCQDTCRNLMGGYECSCENLQDASLTADNHTCEHNKHTGPCSVNNAGCSHTCLSTMGRVFCLCPDGFMLEDDWKTCQDVDECSVPDLQTELCRYGCINTPGSYRCAEPMELKDQPVLDSLSITCLPGYEQTSHGCIDINECVVDNGGCMEVCENTDGSFFCACDGDEKALSSDGKSCVDINSIACLPLNPVDRGYLICSRSATSKLWRDRRKVPNRPSTRCFLKCPRGYQLRGEYELTCRSDGTWDGPQHGKCVRYSKPRLECPKDVVAELPPGRDEAFVTFDQPATDLDWFRYVRSKPSWGTRLEANLEPGMHEVTFFARHPVSKKQASCVLRIIVKANPKLVGGEAPKVNNCPRDIEVVGRNGTAIMWTEPTFTDNVKVTRISNNESPGRRFDIGGHRIEYEASDDAGWSSKCVFVVVLRQG